MHYIDSIRNFKATCEQERTDQEIILDMYKVYGDQILTRAVDLAHITASAIILNEDHSKMLMIHHNIYKTWTWTGGHADGESDLLKVAWKELEEETGLQKCIPISEDIVSLDILMVESHVKNGKYIPPHLHLNVAYVFVGSEDEETILNEKETSGLRWIPISEVASHSGEEAIIYVYNKLLQGCGLDIVL